MYYHGLGPQRPNAASKGYILSAFSADAEHWEKEPGVRMDGGRGRRRALHLEPRRHSPSGWPLPHVLRGEDREGGRPSQSRNCECCFRRRSGLGARAGPAPSRSKRLLSGTSLSSPRPRPQSRAAPAFRLYASAYPYPDVSLPSACSNRNIVSAVSEDGLVFELEPGVRIPQDRAFESSAVYAPEVLRLGEGGFRMYYAGWTSAPEVPRGSKYHGQNLQRIFQGRSAVGQGSGNLH